MSTMNVTEARASFPEILQRVQHGDEVVITKHGRPVAVILHPDAVRMRRAKEAYALADEIEEMLASTEGQPFVPALSPGRADELIRDIRRGRDAR